MKYLKLILWSLLYIIGAILYYFLLYPRLKLEYLRGKDRGAKVIRTDEGIFGDDVWFDPNQEPIDETISFKQFWKAYKFDMESKGLL